MIAAITAGIALGWGVNGPNMVEVSRGQKIAAKWDRDHWRRQLELPPETSQLTDISEVFQEDRVVLGTWSEGWRKLDVEWAILLSPQLISRWLGFLSVREAWPEGELVRRWEWVRQEIGDRPVFIVILSAFPKKELLGLGDTTAPSTDELENIRIVFETHGRVTEAMSYELLTTRAESRSRIDSVPWWQLTRLDGALTFEFEKRFEEPLIPRGDFHRSWRWVVPMDELVCSRTTLKIVSRRKIRSAGFSLVSNSGT